jgi:hypothetical protein
VINGVIPTIIILLPGSHRDCDPKGEVSSRSGVTTPVLLEPVLLSAKKAELSRIERQCCLGLQEN